MCAMSIVRLSIDADMEDWVIPDRGFEELIVVRDGLMI
nr:MAG TPA: hypothetical protein [Caudoviricetes sp.]